MLRNYLNQMIYLKINLGWLKLTRNYLNISILLFTEQ